MAGWYGPHTQSPGHGMSSRDVCVGNRHAATSQPSTLSSHGQHSLPLTATTAVLPGSGGRALPPRLPVGGAGPVVEEQRVGGPGREGPLRCGPPRIPAAPRARVLLCTGEPATNLIPDILMGNMAAAGCVSFCMQSFLRAQGWREYRQYSHHGAPCRWQVRYQAFLGGRGLL